jgi:hypothetical protein
VKVALAVVSPVCLPVIALVRSTALHIQPVEAALRAITSVVDGVPVAPTVILIAKVPLLTTVGEVPSPLVTDGAEFPSPHIWLLAWFWSRLTAIVAAEIVPAPPADALLLNSMVELELAIDAAVPKMNSPAPLATVTLVALAAPSVGVTKVGEVARTTAPEPVDPSDKSATAGRVSAGTPDVEMLATH